MVGLLFLVSEDINEVVGFTAHMESTTTFNRDDVIQFPDISSNFGNYYNSQTGIFLCPYDGVYIFFSSLFGEGSDVAGQIRRDLTGFSSTVSEVEFTSGSNMAVMDCMRGQKVWMRQQLDNDVYFGASRCTFSGYLLHRY